MCLTLAIILFVRFLSSYNHQRSNARTLSSCTETATPPGTTIYRGFVQKMYKKDTYVYTIECSYTRRRRLCTAFVPRKGHLAKAYSTCFRATLLSRLCILPHTHARTDHKYLNYTCSTEANAASTFLHFQHPPRSLSFARNSLSSLPPEMKEVEAHTTIHWHNPLYLHFGFGGRLAEQPSEEVAVEQVQEMER